MQRQNLDQSVIAIVRLVLVILIAAWWGAPAGAFARPKQSVPAAFKNLRPMQVFVVRDGKTGCEPNCAEWISAEGDIVDRTTADFRKILKTLGTRKLPVFIHSGGGSIEAAISIGNMLRDRQLDVAVMRTDYAACPPAAKPCGGDVASPRLGSPDARTAYCASACTLVLAAGVRRLASPQSHVGVHQIIVYQTQIRIRRTYRVTTSQQPGGSVHTQRQLVREQRFPGKTYMVNVDDATYRPIEVYLNRMGIDPALIPLMEATPNTSIHWMSHNELQSTRMVTEEEAGGKLLLPVPADASSPVAAAEVPVRFRGQDISLAFEVARLVSRPKLEFKVMLHQGTEKLPSKGVYAELAFDAGHAVRAYNIDAVDASAPLDGVAPAEAWCRSKRSGQLQISLHSTMPASQVDGDTRAVQLQVASVPGLSGLLAGACKTVSSAAN